MATIPEHEVVLAILREEHQRGTVRDRLAFAVGTRMQTLAMQTLDTLDDEALWTEPCKHRRIAHCGGLYRCLNCGDTSAMIRALWEAELT